MNWKQKCELLKPHDVAVLCGGTSSERKISLRSGKAIAKALKKAGMSVFSVDPAKQGWFEKLKKKADFVFIALHGAGGEDGTLQDKLDRAGIIYVGSDAISSRLAFDKYLSKKVFSEKKISSADFRLVRLSNWKRKIKGMKTPLVFKPLRDGSSIGVVMVDDLSKDESLIEQALKKYKEMLVEKKIVGREFTVGILGEKALPVIELAPKRKFYDFKAKYTKGLTNYLVPAPIAKKFSEKLQKMALEVHNALGLRDVSRVDIMADENENAYVLEANSIPGFTELSLLPKAAKLEGYRFEQLCVELLYLAYQRNHH